MKRKLISVLLGLTMTASLTACSAHGTENTPSKDTVPTGGLVDGSAGTDFPAEGNSVAGAVTCPINMTPSAENNYPYMGVSVKLPENLLNAVLDNKIFMRSNEEVEYTDLGSANMVPVGWRPTAENTILHGGAVELLFVPEEMRERTPRMGMDDPMRYDEYEIWVQDTIPMAQIHMYLKSEFQESMLKEDGYAEHDKLGENAQFIYYLCYNKSDDSMTQEAKDLFTALNELKNGISIFEAKPMDDTYFGITTPDVNQVSWVGSFQTRTIDGEAIDQSFFSNKKLTMINAWTTWCGACIDEMPDLEELARELKDTDAQIISIVCDTADARGEIDEELLELAQQIAKRTGITFPSLIPDASLKDGLLQGILGYPTTWFVDGNGNIIGEAVLGSNSKEDWMALIQERLEEVAK